MDLKEFVKNVLKDTIDAVEEIRKESSRDMYLVGGSDERTIEFDIAVTAEDSTSGSGRAGIKVFQVIEGSTDMSKEVKNSTISRIQFGVSINRWTKTEERQHEANAHAAQNSLDSYNSTF